MIWEIVKKQYRVFTRDWLQLLLLIGLPILLIIILSISLSGFISGSTIDMEANVGFIEHTSEEKQMEQFIEEIEHSMPQEEVSSIKEQVKNFAPINTLKNEVFAELDNMFHM